MIRAALAGLVLAFVATASLAAPTFPTLTGRVVDAAGILPPETEAALTARLEGLETSTGRQLVVATLPDLQGYEIEEYGYQLGRAWGIGSKARNDGAVFIVAPTERKVRIEVGYGLEGVLTDALSSVILQTAVLPRFKAGDMAGGVTAGTDAIIAQLSLDPASAEARANAAATRSEAESGDDLQFNQIAFFILVVIVILMLRSRMGGRRSRSGLWAPPIIIGGSGWSGRDRDGGGWGGGGGFSGGGGSFGGGGSSGSW